IPFAVRLKKRLTSVVIIKFFGLLGYEQPL
ncbi:hypothetical protein EVA_19952, partial [gut metagenome]